MALSPLLHRKLAFVAPAVQDRASLLGLFARRAAALLNLAPSGGLDSAKLVELLEAREALQSTVLTEGIAFPHAIGEGLSPPLLGVARLEPPLRYDPLRSPIVLCFALFGDSATPAAHVRTLARLARIVNDLDSRARLLAAATPGELLQTLRDEDARQHP